ncbi:cupin domain-containing protein [Achromobacter sp. F4_2707]|uniref:cupin domain-containing protein n=1 Tax=Achromobacter sp. F4_2707 TaxID=3114286 RepID=UPI0039C62A8C
MNIDQPLTLLGGISPQEFMNRYWQKQPLLIRQAIPDYKPNLRPADIRKLVKREEVESRLIWQEDGVWNMDKGPFTKLPSTRKPGWTVLAQSVDLHDDGMAELMRRFRFISDARLDDVMISVATKDGGVGPHFDSYDVFLLQGHGTRRWRISQQTDLELIPGLPCKILQRFEAEQEFVLEPGDMLYLPPHVAHDGIAETHDCMTISIGFRAPSHGALAYGMLHAMSDQLMANLGNDDGVYARPTIPGPVLDDTYKDPGANATRTPAKLPNALLDTTIDAVRQLPRGRKQAARFLGQWLTELPDNAYFIPGDDVLPDHEPMPAIGRLVLDRCTRMMYRGKELYINGEVAPVQASSRMRALADERELTCSASLLKKLKRSEEAALRDWIAEGWVHYLED